MFGHRVLASWFMLCTCTILRAHETPRDDLPSIWNEIEKHAKAVSASSDQSEISRARMCWKIAAQIAQGRDRSDIDRLFKSFPKYDNLQASDDADDIRQWSKELSAYVIVTIAEQRGKNEISGYLANWPGKARSPVRWTGIAIASMDYIHDDASRRWLFDLAMNGDTSPIGNDEYLIPGSSYFALQLLRGYEPTPEMRKQIEEALVNVKASNTVKRFPSISRSDALRSLVSSWDYAKNLPEKSTGSKYLAFQSTLWRYNAIAPHTFIDQSFRYVEIARQLAKTWDVCHDRFVLEIFQNPNTTPDEAKIAICLVEKLTDTNELERIARGDSPSAHYAKEALEILRQSRKTPLRDIP